MRSFRTGLHKLRDLRPKVQRGFFNLFGDYPRRDHGGRPARHPAGNIRARLDHGHSSAHARSIRSVAAGLPAFRHLGRSLRQAWNVRRRVVDNANASITSFKRVSACTPEGGIDAFGPLRAFAPCPADASLQPHAIAKKKQSPQPAALSCHCWREPSMCSTNCATAGR